MTAAMSDDRLSERMETQIKAVDWINEKLSKMTIDEIIVLSKMQYEITKSYFWDCVYNSALHSTMVQPQMPSVKRTYKHENQTTLDVIE